MNEWQKSNGYNFIDYHQRTSYMFNRLILIHRMSFKCFEDVPYFVNVHPSNHSTKTLHNFIQSLSLSVCPLSLLFSPFFLSHFFPFSLSLFFLSLSSPLNPLTSFALFLYVSFIALFALLLEHFPSFFNLFPLSLSFLILTHFSLSLSLSFLSQFHLVFLRLPIY